MAWAVLTDIRRVAPCLPGAELVEINDGAFHGIVRLKLGPISASYAGTARFESLDDESRSVVILANGRDRHGRGTATARVEAQLTEVAGGTRIDMVQDVDITGKAAQFGRGVLADVSKQMMGRFAAALTEMINEEERAACPAAAAAPAAAGPAVSLGKPPALSVLSLVRSVVVGRIRALTVAVRGRGRRSSHPVEGERE